MYGIKHAYVGGNPATRTDPTGACPFCIAALIGAVAGAAISYGSQVVSNVQQGGFSASAFTHVDAGKIALSAVAGAIIGATGGAASSGLAGLLGVETMGAGAAIGAATGAAEGGLTQVANNLINGQQWDEGLGQAVLFGGITGGLGAAASEALNQFGTKALQAAAKGAGKGCGNSFDPATPVATPDGAKPIGGIQVGDTVTAYDPTTGQTKAEPVEHVFINHDTNLLDVTLAPLAKTATIAAQDDAASPKEAHAAIASHGTRAPPTSQPETLHTTTEHPFLTTDRGFVDAAKLRVGEQVQQLDGHVGVVVAVTVTPGAAVRYNLTVRELHTFAVGAGQWVVHNCPKPNYDTFERYGNAEETSGASSTGRLSQRPGHNGPDGGVKWIANEGVVTPQNLSSGAKWRTNYGWRMTIRTQPGTREWLENIGGMLKDNEPGRYGIPNQYLDKFNERIVAITVSRVG